VRFATKPLAPSREGPRFVDNAIVPTLVATSATSVRVSFPAGFDRDNRNLRYRVIRDGAFGTPVYDTSADSNWWTLPQMGFVDTGLAAGSTHSYQVRINDPDGNEVIGASASVTMPTSFAPATAYAAAVRSNGARIYWPLNDAGGLSCPSTSPPGNNCRITDRAAGTTSSSGIGVTDGRRDSGVTLGQAGAIAGDNAALLGDNNSSRVYAGNCSALGGCNWGTETAPDSFTSQVWIKTSSTRGGRILGFSDIQYREEGSGHHDRHVYMANDGRLLFGVRGQDGSNRTIASSAAYNNNQWHMVTATMSPAGMRLYVDAVLVASRTDTTQGEAYLGYWRLGGDSLGGWTSQPATPNFTGTVDEVAIYPTALAQSQISAQYAARNGVPPPNQTPVAAFTSSTSGLTVSVNGNTSSDPDGSIAGYAWAFGDATTATGATASHTYATAGQKTITLTVTDNQGATDTEVQQVTVTAAAEIANDTFDRTVTDAWGTANSGGAWTTTTSATNFRVVGGAGKLRMAAGSGPSAYLNSVSARDVDLTSSFTYDKAGTGGGVYTSFRHTTDRHV
jgi:PKD repeat protein